MEKHSTIRDKIGSVFKAARDASGGPDADLMICIEMNYFNDGEISVCISDSNDNSQMVFEVKFRKDEFVIDVLTFLHDEMEFFKEAVRSKEMMLSEFYDFTASIDMSEDVYTKYEHALRQFYKLARLSWKLYRSGDLKLKNKIHLRCDER